MYIHLSFHACEWYGAASWGQHTKRTAAGPPATTLIYAIGAGITVAAGTRLALQ